MQFLNIVLALFATAAMAAPQSNSQLPDCVSLGDNAEGLEQFDGSVRCLLPARCGNGDGGERCVRVNEG